jgi:hypothetical protein
MATSETQIANMALAHVGNGNQIANLSEKSNEARACLQFYETCRDEVLGAFPWPFATVITALTLVATDPTTEFAYAYRYPPDALTLHRIPTGYDRVSAAALCYPMLSCEWPFTRLLGSCRIVQSAGAQLIYTDQPDALAEYTVREKDPTKFPADFAKALALRLAGDIAPMVTQGDPKNYGDRALKRYELAISAARTRAANEERMDPPRDSDLITSRY